MSFPWMDDDEDDILGFSAFSQQPQQQQQQQQQARITPPQRSSSLSRPQQQPCKYGVGCYRTSREHREHFSHPGDSAASPASVISISSGGGGDDGPASSSPDVVCVNGDLDEDAALREALRRSVSDPFEVTFSPTDSPAAADSAPASNGAAASGARNSSSVPSLVFFDEEDVDEGEEEDELPRPHTKRKRSVKLDAVPPARDGQSAVRYDEMFSSPSSSDTEEDNLSSGVTMSQPLPKRPRVPTPSRAVDDADAIDLTLSPAKAVTKTREYAAAGSRHSGVSNPQQQQQEPQQQHQQQQQQQRPHDQPKRGSKPPKFGSGASKAEESDDESQLCACSILSREPGTTCVLHGLGVHKNPKHGPQPPPRGAAQVIRAPAKPSDPIDSRPLLELVKAACGATQRDPIDQPALNKWLKPSQKDKFSLLTLFCDVHLVNANQVCICFCASRFWTLRLTFFYREVLYSPNCKRKLKA
jgi:PBZ domain